MFKNMSNIFLLVFLVTAMTIGPFGLDQVSARAVTSQNIEEQETVARDTSKAAIEEYMRLLLYMIIFKLENRVESS